MPPLVQVHAYRTIQDVQGLITLLRSVLESEAETDEFRATQLHREIRGALDEAETELENFHPNDGDGLNAFVRRLWHQIRNLERGRREDLALSTEFRDRAVIDPPHRDFPFRASEWDTYTRPPRYGHTGDVLGGWGTHGFTIFEDPPDAEDPSPAVSGRDWVANRRADESSSDEDDDSDEEESDEEDFPEVSDEEGSDEEGSEDGNSDDEDSDEEDANEDPATVARRIAAWNAWTQTMSERLAALPTGDTPEETTESTPQRTSNQGQPAERPAVPTIRLPPAPTLTRPIPGTTTRTPPSVPRAETTAARGQPPARATAAVIQQPSVPTSARPASEAVARAVPSVATTGATTTGGQPIARPAAPGNRHVPVPPYTRPRPAAMTARGQPTARREIPERTVTRPDADARRFVVHYANAPSTEDIWREVLERPASIDNHFTWALAYRNREDRETRDPDFGDVTNTSPAERVLESTDQEVYQLGLELWRLLPRRSFQQ